jgi:uncharacterized protein with von Willebrand factor type A (vWA) domain
MPPEPVDVPLLAAHFGRAVRAAGIPCGPERSARFAHALQLAPPGSRDRLYWTARAVFVSAHAQVGAFDGVFARVFDGLVDPADARGDQHGPPPPGAQRGDRPPAARAPRTSGPPPGGGAARASSSPIAAPRADDTMQELAVPVASADERLASKDFADLEPDELLALRRLMSQLQVATPTRRTRRARRARRGERLDVRATLRASHRTGGDPVRQVRRRRLREHRSLVVLCDVSGSMEPYSRAFLMFLHSAVGGARAEAFVFATRLTRLTRALRGRQPDLAIARAAATAPDWSGGTRIGAALGQFNDNYGRRGMARGAVIVIVSDGWEVGDPERVRREMARLRRLAHRIVWVNPRLAAPGFRPAAGGMAAALPFCDALVGGHDLHALGDAIAAIGARPTTTPS